MKRFNQRTQTLLSLQAAVRALPKSADCRIAGKRGNQFIRLNIGDVPMVFDPISHIEVRVCVPQFFELPSGRQAQETAAALNDYLDRGKFLVRGSSLVYVSILDSPHGGVPEETNLRSAVAEALLSVLLVIRACEATVRRKRASHALSRCRHPELN